MLVGLSFPVDYSDASKNTLIDSVALSLGRTTKVLRPQTREELSAELKAHRPSKRYTTLLTNTHFNIEQNSEESVWRIADHQFSTRGGVIYGAAASRDTNTYAYKIPADLGHIANNALYAAQRAMGSIPGYFGRTYTDPHTILTDIKPSYAKPVQHVSSLFSAIHKTWWLGVGFFSPSTTVLAQRYLELAEKYPYASIIATKKDTSVLLTALDIRHTYAELAKFKTSKEYDNYASTIRELSREDLLTVV